MFIIDIICLGIRVGVTKEDEMYDRPEHKVKNLKTAIDTL